MSLKTAAELSDAPVMKDLRNLSPMSQQAIEWIANNDEDAVTDVEQIQDQVTVQLVSDVFNLRPDFIAKLVVALRKLRR